MSKVHVRGVYVCWCVLCVCVCLVSYLRCVFDVLPDALHYFTVTEAKFALTVAL